MFVVLAQGLLVLTVYVVLSVVQACVPEAPCALGEIVFWVFALYSHALAPALHAQSEAQIVQLGVDPMWICQVPDLPMRYVAGCAMQALVALVVLQAWGLL